MHRNRERTGIPRSALLVAALCLFLPIPPTHAQETASVQGLVHNAETGGPLDYANIVLTRVSDQATWGAMSLGGGRFFLRGIPAGRYELKVLYLGYKPVTEIVELVAGETLELDFGLEVTVVKEFDVFTVEGASVMVEVKRTEFSQSIGSEDLTDYAVDSVEDAVARQAGIVQRNGEFYVRGGRPGELSFRIDGVSVDNPLGGRLSVGNFSVANISTITGGRDPEYGNAMSGVVNITTREGNPERFEARARFMTDDFGRQDRTFTNYDRLELGFGGPSHLSDKLTYYVSGDLQFSDLENYNRAHRPEHSLELFGATLATWRRRQFNDVKGSTKWAYFFNEDHKLTAEYTLAYSRSEIYAPDWDVQGYARQLLRFPQLEQGTTSLEFSGRYTTVYYGPWVDRMEELSQSRLVRDVVGNTPRTSQVMPVMQVRNTRGERVLVIAQPVFQGFQNDQSLFSTVPEDSSYVAINSADNGPQFDRFTQQMKLVWRSTLTDDTFYTLRLARVSFDNEQTVGDNKRPYEFLHGGIRSPGPFGRQTNAYAGNSDYYTDPDHPVFVTTSEFLLYRDQETGVYSFDFDITSNRYESHRMKAGVRVVYNDLKETSLAGPAQETVDRLTGQVQPGTSRNTFHTFNPEASFYMQDRWEYEGMVMSGGFRWDMFSPGSARTIDVYNEDLSRNVTTYKHRFSPRIGFAFPITDRTGFHFHYGRFVQFPPRNVLFASQDAIGGAGRTLGNPNLEEQTTITYQAGVKQQFTDHLAVQFAVYSKDMYGLIAATQVTDQATGQTVDRYINKAYGNSRGLEITMERRFHDRWSFETSYTYSFSDGVASSQEFGSNPDALEFLPNQELPLNWDERVKVNLSLRIAEPNSWAAALTYDYGSGFPWTPLHRFERRQDPLLENSERLPATNSLALQAERHVNLYGQKLILYFQGHNLLNEDQVTTIAPPLGSLPGVAQPAYRAYLTETGKYGGAYLQDIDGDNRDDFVPMNDPRVFADHRLFRVGVGWIY